MSNRHVEDEVPRDRFAGFKRALKDKVREGIGRHAPYLVRRITNFHRLEDRLLLENTILPFFRDEPTIRRILFVGTEWYTKPYERLFRNKEYWTLEIDPSKSRFGARRHVTAPLKNLPAYAPDDYFDAIIANGMFFITAIDTREEAEPSFAVSYRCLKPGGWFMLGWNDDERYRPYPPAESPNLAAFERAVFPPLGTDEYRTSTEYRHVFTFYRKPHA